MLVYRQIELNDIDAIIELSTLGGVGFTSLALDPNRLNQRIHHAVNSFKKIVTEPGDEDYLFVLEDTQQKKVIGISGVIANLGIEAPFYSYRLSRKTRISQTLKIRHEYQLLHLVNDYQGCSEVCSLLLNPHYRKRGTGVFLSRARFLFMANHPERFQSVVIAEMRGYITEKGESPFWNAIGRHFFKMSFKQADELTVQTNKQFIADLMPRHAIYLDMLPEEAHACIGKAHEATKPALHILNKEGFYYRGYLDIFDGGPAIESSFNGIKTIHQSQLVSVKAIDTVTTAPLFLVATITSPFKVIKVPVYCCDEDHILLNPDAAEILNVQEGDTLRVVPF